MRFAFLILGDFSSDVDRAAIASGSASIIGVKDIDEAVSIARKLYKEGVECIELCGAFTSQGARKIIEATDNRIPIGYVTHLPEQDDIYESVFGCKS